MPKFLETNPTALVKPPPGPKVSPAGSQSVQPASTTQGTSIESPRTPKSHISIARMPVEAGSKEYNMNHKRRGVAVIFNNVTFDDNIKYRERKGSCVDADNLVETFELLGFETTVHKDLTRSEITAELESLGETDFDDCDCICIVALTHGGAFDLLRARDAGYQTSELWERFIPSRCPSLAGKPKLFFIQACRGEQFEQNTLLVKGGVPSGTHVDSQMYDWSYTIPSRVDFLISHSTYPGFYSWRNEIRGSWYIQALCRTLSAEHTSTDLLTMLTTVHREVAIYFKSSVKDRPDLSGLKQTPSFTSTLMRNVYFRPKERVPGEVSVPLEDQAGAGES